MSGAAPCEVCRQHTRLLRIESEAAKQAQKYHDRDETIRKALLELRGEVVSIGANVSEQIGSLRACVENAVKAIPKRRTGNGGNGKCR